MLLLHLTDIDEARWVLELKARLAGYPVVRRGDTFDPRAISYILAWKPAEDAFAGLTGLKAILSLGAGVDALMKHKALPAVPIVRFVDTDLTQRMTDYVVAHVGMHHRCLTRFAADQQARRWTQFYPPSAAQTQVGIMGAGVLGSDAARKLVGLGFSVRMWSRTPKVLEGVQSFTGDGLTEFLAGTDILVNLLPLTPETQGILNLSTFRQLRRNGLAGGPVVINAARGGHQREADIVTALTDGTLGAASLDVFETEPLPQHSPLWALPNCYITPHIAAISSPESGPRYFAKVLLDHEAGQPLINVVDRQLGY